MRWRRAAGLAAVSLTVSLTAAACSNVVSGSGHLAEAPPVTAPPSAAPSGAPSTGSAGRSARPRNPLACPQISYTAGRLTFRCIASGLIPVSHDPVWALSLAKNVEPNWVMNEGARPVQPLHGRSLQAVATGLRAAMLANGEYGDSPSVRTIQARGTTVAGVPGYVLETEVGVNPAYRAQFGLHVQVERLWIVVLNAGDDQVASWFVSVPDDVRQLWPAVPGLIGSLGLI